MKLSQLIQSIPVVTVILPSDASDPDTDITCIRYRSTDVTPGDLFVAIPGFKSDGHDYIRDACSRGASAVAAQRPVECPVPLIQVEDARKSLALLSACFYGNPSDKLFMIGITGTNGKTTTSYLIENIMISSGLNVGVIGTVNYRFAGHTFPNPMTTPESTELQSILSDMVQNGVTHVVMEATSHAIDLHRMDGCRFDIGVFTNLTQDHLDFHKDMESYWNCKKRLFTELMANESIAVINCLHTKGTELAEQLNMPVITVGECSPPLKKPCIRATDTMISETGIRGAIQTPAGAFQFRSPLTGTFNLENILCAAGVGIAMGLPTEAIRRGIESLQAVPGRLEYVPNRQKRYVYVDFAHTPDALENVLSTLKSMAKKRIITVFGCGGDRDRAKRPKMGEIVGRFSDIAIVTSDNPRSENPTDIIREIIPGLTASCPEEFQPDDPDSAAVKKGYVSIPDRKTAIRTAVRISQPEDIVLIAGKGHEPYQIIGNRKISFDDRQIAKEALSENVPHPTMVRS